jgi:asparagine synthase (glutamine-hydrolysing)
LLRARSARQRVRLAMRALARFHPGLKTVRRSLKSMGQRTRVVEFAGSAAFVRSLVLRDPGGFAPPSETDELPHEWDETNRDLYRMFHSSVLPALLRNFDRLSMAHGVESRMPFMDHRLVTYTMNLPSRFKLGDGYTKRVARVGLEGLMPDGIRLSRRKVGFGAPMPEWLNGPLREWALDLAASAHARNHPVINGRALLRFVSDRASKRDWQWANTAAGWACLHLLVFERMLRGYSAT